MASRSIRAVIQARKVADFLDGLGEHKRANDIRHVCRSNDSFRVTLATLHRDNMALRAVGKPYQAPPYPAPRTARCTVRADLIEHAAALIRDRDPKLASLFARMSQEAAA